MKTESRGGIRALFGLLEPHVRPRLGAMFAVLVLATISALGQRAPLLLVQPLLDRVVFSSEENREEETDTWFEAVQGAVVGPFLGEPTDPEAERFAALWTIGVLLALAAVVAPAAHYGFLCLSRWIALRTVVDLRLQLARHLLALPLAYHGRRSFGDLLSRVGEDAGRTLFVVRDALRNLVMEPLLIVGSLGVAAYAAPMPTLVVVLFLVPVFIPVSLLARRVERGSKTSLESLGSSVQVLTQMLSGIRTVKAFRAEEREFESYRATNERYVDDSMKMERAVALSKAATLLVSHLGFALLLVGAVWLTIRGEVFGDGSRLLTFFVAIGLSYTHIRRTVEALNRVQESAGAAERLREVLDEPAEPDEPGADVEPPRFESEVAFEGVTYAYPEADRPALEEVTLSIGKGETLALVGPSGAGKTTFVDLVAGFLRPDAGRILVDGRDLTTISRGDWTRMFALVGQEPFLFHASVLDNVLYGRPDATRAEVEAAARAAHAERFVRDLSAGWETLVGDAGALLSGGERQRITVARAILKGAPILLLDEATSALDSESEEAVRDALETLMADRTVIVIAHRLSTIRGADRIAVLEAGRLRELGTHDELMARNGLYTRLHDVQAGSVPEPA